MLIAELLTFVETAHRDGLLLNGLDPEAFVVDAEGRPGYLASDCVVPRDVRPRPLFPPERYAVGFSPPECFEAADSLDERGDLFSWAAIAFFALTGDDLQALA